MANRLVELKPSDIINSDTGLINTDLLANPDLILQTMPSPSFQECVTGKLVSIGVDDNTGGLIIFIRSGFARLLSEDKVYSFRPDSENTWFRGQEEFKYTILKWLIINSKQRKIKPPD
jgi:hypothetical protein